MILPENYGMETIYRITHTYSLKPSEQEEWFISDYPEQSIIELCGWIQLKSEVLIDYCFCLEESQVLKLLSKIIECKPFYETETVPFKKALSSYRTKELNMYTIRETFCGTGIKSFLNKYNYKIIDKELEKLKKPYLEQQEKDYLGIHGKEKGLIEFKNHRKRHLKTINECYL